MEGPVDCDALIVGIRGLGLQIVAYADDAAILVEADSRDDLERRGNAALVEVGRWAHLNKLSVSTTKSTSILLKGNLDPGHGCSFGWGSIGLLRVSRLSIWGSTLPGVLGSVCPSKASEV